MTRPVYITRSAVFLPGAAVSNDDMEWVLGQAGGRPSRARRMVLRSNRITSRHYAIDPLTGKPTHSNAQMTAEAIRRLSPAIALSDISCLACGTTLPDQLAPNHAVMVQGELGLPAIEAVATSGICLAGLTALKYAMMSVACGQHENAVATGSEMSSALLAARNFEAELDAKVDELEQRPELAFEKDFLRWMLSDGAGALLVESAPRADDVNLRIEWIDILSYAGEMETCMYAGARKREDGGVDSWLTMAREERDGDSAMALKQDVKLLNENIVRYTVEKPAPIVAERRNLRPSDVDWFLPHYSSDFFRDRLQQGLQAAGFEIPQERWFTNLYDKGNTGSASIYVMLDELMASGRLERGQTVLCWVPESGRFSSGFMLLRAV